jgi:hypothetical protein
MLRHIRFTAALVIGVTAVAVMAAGSGGARGAAIVSAAHKSMISPTPTPSSGPLSGTAPAGTGTAPITRLANSTPIQYALLQNNGLGYCCDYGGYQYYPAVADTGANNYFVTDEIYYTKDFELTNKNDWSGFATYHLYEPNKGYMNWIPSTNKFVLSGYSSDTNEQFWFSDDGGGSGDNWIVNRAATYADRQYEYLTSTSIQLGQYPLDAENSGQGGRAAWRLECQNCG